VDTPIKKINYHEIDIPNPDKKPKEKWDTEERRAYILDLIVEKGHPKFINQTKIAQEFGVSQPAIHDDIDAIADSVNDYLGEKADLMLESIYKSSIRELKEEKDYSELRKWIKDWSQYLMERGKVKKAPERTQVEFRPVEFNMVEVIEEEAER